MLQLDGTNSKPVESNIGGKISAKAKAYQMKLSPIRNESTNKIGGLPITPSNSDRPIIGTHRTKGGLKQTVSRESSDDYSDLLSPSVVGKIVSN